MFWYNHGAGGWGWFAMSVGTVLFWALIIMVGVLLFRWLSRTGTRGDEGAGRTAAPPHAAPPHAGPTPEQILAERYARGEIEDEEYRRRLATLRSSAQGPGSGAGPGSAQGPARP
ncbi:SHOCT domain-containing protein [Streptomyces sp. NPDC020742]|uniref:SHOCT domain-containing protein n=1 Tax=unclassified Streptomyces TaxID=2593676 RepID=UPI0033CD5BCE